MATARRILDSILSWTLISLMLVLTTLVVTAVLYRKLGASLSWYDEVASVLLAWITYYGAALAALRRSHIGFDGVLLALPPHWRVVGAAVAEILVIGFFVILAWAGWEILKVLEGTNLVSLSWVPIQLTQSVIPIGAVLFIIAELLSIPPYLAELRLGISTEHPPMVHEQVQGS